MLMKQKNAIRIQRYHSPCGELLIGSFEGKLCLCDWVTAKHREAADRRLRLFLQADYEALPSEVLHEASRQLDEYFGGRRKAFDIPLLPVGTEFQQRVWRKLREIPYGTTVSYKELAARLGAPQAVRAVANANGANILSIFIPCHRVVGINRTLTGYAGGLEAKRRLLSAETGNSLVFHHI